MAKITYWDVGGRRSRMLLNMGACLQTAIRDFVGTRNKGLGTCMSATLTGKDSPEYSGLTNATINLEYMDGAL